MASHRDQQGAQIGDDAEDEPLDERRGCDAHRQQHHRAGGPRPAGPHTDRGRRSRPRLSIVDGGCGNMLVSTGGLAPTSPAIWCQGVQPVLDGAKGTASAGRQGRPRRRDRTGHFSTRVLGQAAADLLELLPATPAGLTSDEATRRVRLYGPNSFVRESRFAGRGVSSASWPIPSSSSSSWPAPLLSRSVVHGRRSDHHLDGPVQPATELLHGVPG